ncbi:nucleotidyltransferase domain-containing protein [Caldilinea sp.]|uniref:nucleotidyltransferase domain-containing protein n=1 Tax=Caldilinea sp. TaxID=2293560 RepID=UPI0021DED3D7|nr:nucleotidyltransferase domain-containing protein [Caldilinea sp.]GIV70101.1 MAG: hypothetical protein KatS3mg048_2963 [Caldilinea sp.]
MSISLPDAMPRDHQNTVAAVVAALAQTPGVIAVVLGGSYARGTARPDSDVDLGVYYEPSAPFHLNAIAKIAQSVAIRPPTVTDFYEWGAWVNGGAWIQTATGKIDLLYRNLDQVKRTIEEAEQGLVHHDYPQQPPYGFYSVIYLAETHFCAPLADSSGAIQTLKERVRVYPERLHRRVVNDGLWSVEFTLLHADSFAAQGDVYNTVGCMTRVATTLTQVLFALNRCYFISDKGVMTTIEQFSQKPEGFTEEISAILAAPGAEAAALKQSVQRLWALWRRTVELTGARYRPKFALQ